MKNIRIFCLKFLIILLVKFSVYLNRHVFVMIPSDVSKHDGHVVNIDWLQSFLQLFFFCHSLSLSVAVFVSLIPFHCFTTLSYPLRGVTYQSIISCTGLYTFEKKKENDRKDRVWRQTSDKQCRPRSDAAFCGVWSVSTQFALTCLCKYVE